MWIKRRALCPCPCVPWGAFGSDTRQRVGLWYRFGSFGPLSCHFSGFNLRAVCRRVLGPSTEKVLSSGGRFSCVPLVFVPYSGRVWQNLSLLAVFCLCYGVTDLVTPMFIPARPVPWLWGPLVGLSERFLFPWVYLLGCRVLRRSGPCCGPAHGAIMINR